MLSAKLGVRADRLVDQYDDIDVYFRAETPKSAIAVIDDEETWIDSSDAYADKQHHKEFGAFTKTFAAPEAKDANAAPVDLTQPQTFSKLRGLQSRESSFGASARLNVITFKHGTPEQMLSDFDVSSSCVAVDGDDVIVPETYLNEETSGSLFLRQGAIALRSPATWPKSIKRLSKYANRMKKLGLQPRLRDGDAEFIVSLLCEENRHMWTVLGAETQHFLGEVLSFDDVTLLAPLLYKERWFRCEMMRTAMNIDWRGVTTERRKLANTLPL